LQQRLDTGAEGFSAQSHGPEQFHEVARFKHLSLRTEEAQNYVISKFHRERSEFWPGSFFPVSSRADYSFFVAVLLPLPLPFLSQS
jgi:hypothetical protein